MMIFVSDHTNVSEDNNMCICDYKKNKNHFPSVVWVVVCGNRHSDLVVAGDR